MSNKITTITYKKDDTFLTDYLPSSVIFFSCYEHSDDLMNFPNQLEKLDLTFNEQLKKIHIPYKVNQMYSKQLYMKKKCTSLYYSNLNNKIVLKINNFLKNKRACRNRINITT
jgi:hypothetical protein